MPTIFIAGYKFRFYSSGVNEPPHVHVIHDDNEAKIWLEPVQLEYHRGYNPHGLEPRLEVDRTKPSAIIGGVA
jgi:hypothetical protein